MSGSASVVGRFTNMACHTNTRFIIGIAKGTGINQVCKGYRRGQQGHTGQIGWHHTIIQVCAHRKQVPSIAMRVVALNTEQFKITFNFVWITLIAVGFYHLSSTAAAMAGKAEIIIIPR